MVVTKAKKQPKRKAAYASVGQLIEKKRLPFTEQDLVDALVDEETRVPGVVALPAGDQQFWDKNAGIKVSMPSISQAAAADAAARVMMDARALSAHEVGELLGRQNSTIRHYKADHKLYAYERGGRSLFPAWQFNEDRKAIPYLDKVLAGLTLDLHPQAVAGFFLSPQPDLVVNGNPVSSKEWLEHGGPVEPVLNLAHGLSVGI
jgi:hypothetical protein